MIKLRQMSQIIFLGLFLFLLFNTSEAISLFPRLSPLLSITTMIANRNWIIQFLPSLIVLLLTVALGRVFCGWVCPLGTIIDFTDSILARRRFLSLITSKRWKYWLLILLLTISIFGIQMACWFDPLSLVIRTFSLMGYPYLRHLFSPNDPFFTGFNGQFLFLVIFLCIILLSTIESKYWCKNLCPLGALLGVVSYFTWLKKGISKQCTICAKCQKACKMGAITEKGQQTLQIECTRCFSCYDLCQEKAVRFRFTTTKKQDSKTTINISRRQLIISLSTGLLSIPILKFTSQPNSRIIRPPGAIPEKEFLSRCLRCGLCMKVCPSNGLQPCLLEIGFEGIWTPRLIPKIGYCEYYCTLCTQTCPSEAIKKLTEQEKIKEKIGIAVFDKNRCISWVADKNCLICQEICPIPNKAIDFKIIEKGNEIILRPYIIKGRCIGCGACENKCPLQPVPGIFICK